MLDDAAHSFSSIVLFSTVRLLLLLYIFRRVYDRDNISYIYISTTTITILYFRYYMILYRTVHRQRHLDSKWFPNTLNIGTRRPQRGSGFPQPRRCDDDVHRTGNACRHAFAVRAAEEWNTRAATSSVAVAPPAPACNRTRTSATRVVENAEDGSGNVHV